MLSVGLTYWSGNLSFNKVFINHNSKIFDKLILITDTDQSDLSDNVIQIKMTNLELIKLVSSNEVVINYFSIMGPGVISDIPYYYASKLVGKLNSLYNLNLTDYFVVYFDTNTVFWTKYFLHEINRYYNKGKFYTIWNEGHYSSNNYSKYVSGNFCIDLLTDNELRNVFTLLISNEVSRYFNDNKYTLLGPGLLNKYLNELVSFGFEVSNLIIDEPDPCNICEGTNVIRSNKHSIGIGLSNIIFKNAGFKCIDVSICENSLTYELVRIE